MTTDLEKVMHPVSFRVTKELLTEVDDLARAEGRSRTAMVLRLLWVGVEHVRQKKAEGKASVVPGSVVGVGVKKKRTPGEGGDKGSGDGGLEQRHYEAIED